jgi:hypothetical protein
MKSGTVLTAVLLVATAWWLPKASAGPVLYTTLNDWNEWNGSGSISKVGSAAPDLDGTSINGVGNNTAPGAAGTGGSLAATWSSGAFDYFFGDGDQNNAALRTALGTSPSGGYTAAAGVLAFDYTKPPPGTGNYFQLGIVINADNNFGQFFGTETDNGNGTFTANVPYTITASGASSYLQLGFIYNSNYNTNTPFTIDNLRVVPEPATAGLLGIALAGLGLRRSRSR